MLVLRIAVATVGVVLLTVAHAVAARPQIEIWLVDSPPVEALAAANPVALERTYSDIALASSEQPADEPNVIDLWTAREVLYAECLCADFVYVPYCPQWSVHPGMVLLERPIARRNVCSTNQIRTLSSGDVFDTGNAAGSDITLPLHLADESEIEVRYFGALHRDTAVEYGATAPFQLGGYVFFRGATTGIVFTW